MKGVKKLFGKTGAFSLLLLAGVAVALFSDFHRPSPDGFLTRFGFVRTNQLVANMSYADLVRSPQFLLRRVALDPANPYRWAELGEYFTDQDDGSEAARAFDRAVELGPDIPPVLMRAVNFYAIEENPVKVASLGKRIFDLTREFDEILFVDYARLGLTADIPAEPRPARGWLRGLLPNASITQLSGVWTWMTDKELADEATAEAYVTGLWKRQMYLPAAQAWAAWVEPDHSDRLFNRRFASTPKPVPMDWDFGNAAEFELRDGLRIHFTGTEPGRIAVVSQLIPATPGSYRFSAVVSATDITTDQGPFFHIFDAENPQRLDAKTRTFLGTMPRQTVSVTFPVPAATRVITIQIERQPSNKFDNKIKGDLQIYETSLTPGLQGR